MRHLSQHVSRKDGTTGRKLHELGILPQMQGLNCHLFRHSLRGASSVGCIPYHKVRNTPYRQQTINNFNGGIHITSGHKQ